MLKHDVNTVIKVKLSLKNIISGAFYYLNHRHTIIGGVFLVNNTSMQMGKVGREMEECRTT